MVRHKSDKDDDHDTQPLAKNDDRHTNSNVRNNNNVNDLRANNYDLIAQPLTNRDTEQESPPAMIKSVKAM